MIGRSGERGSGISVLAARHDDDDDRFVLKGVLYRFILKRYFIDLFKRGTLLIYFQEGTL